MLASELLTDAVLAELEAALSAAVTALAAARPADPLAFVADALTSPPAPPPLPVGEEGDRYMKLHDKQLEQALEVAVNELEAEQPTVPLDWLASRLASMAAATPPTAPVPAPARGSLAPPDGKPANEAPPAAEFLRLIKEGRVVPDEAAGPYALASYHANVTGAHRGYKDRAGYDAWHAKGKAAMLTFRSWAELNWTKVDPEFAIHYGTINGRGLPMREIRPTIIAARKAMNETYSAAFEAARKPPGAAEVFASIAALPEKTGKVRQPGGTSLDLLGLYRGALAALPGLWRLAGAIAEASGEAGVHASWGVKKPCRIWFKLNTKYGCDVSCAPRRPPPAPRAAHPAAACAVAAAK